MNAITIGGFGRAEQPIRMNSLQIAELVEARPDNVRRTVERLSDDGIIVRPPLEDVPGTDAMGRPRTTKAYVFEGEQGERDSIVVVARLSPEFTARLVDQWRAMKEVLQSKMIALPQDYPSALRALADSSDKVQALETANAELSTKADALDLISASEGSLTFTQAAKMLGVNRETMTKWMNVNGWVYRQNGSWVAYKQHIRNGRLEYKEHSYTSKTTGVRHTNEYCHITQKGLAFLAEIFSDKKGVA